MIYALVFGAAMLAALALTPLVIRLSVRTGIVAEPGGRRKHHGRIPKLGGLAILGAWLIGVVLIYWLMPPTNPDDALRLRGVVLGSLVMVAGGLIDDWRDLRPGWQFLIQFLGAAIAVAHIIFIEVFTNPLPGDWLWTQTPLALVFRPEGDLVWIWRPLAILITVFWVVGMINAVNFLDGLDGLAAGVCLVAASLFAWHSYRLGQTTVSLFPLALAQEHCWVSSFSTLLGAHLPGDRPVRICWATRWLPCLSCLRRNSPQPCWSWQCLLLMSPGRSCRGCAGANLHFRVIAVIYTSGWPIGDWIRAGLFWAITWSPFFLGWSR
ncbi:MAG: MraY family glycosyltransferase [Chloroflexota bacterium]